MNAGVTFAFSVSRGCARRPNKSSRSDRFSGEPFRIGDVQFDYPEIRVVAQAARQPLGNCHRVVYRRRISHPPAVPAIKISRAFKNKRWYAAIRAFDQYRARAIIATPDDCAKTTRRLHPPEQSGNEHAA
jgi:hypothetical protein